MTKWTKTTFPGVRFREHPTRKHGVKKDQYFTIRYKQAGRDKEEGLGWASEGWTSAKAYERLSELKTNQKVGEGPQTMSEKRGMEAAKKVAQQAEQTRQEKEAVSFCDFFKHDYLPQARADKKPRSVERENGLYTRWIHPSIGKRPLKNIAAFHLEGLKRDMKNGGQSARSIEYALAVVRQVFNTAKRLGVYTGENPTTQVKFPKPDNGRMRYLTRDEADRLLAALKEKSADVHDMTLLSFHAGLRFGEIASLTWQDVDMNKEVLTIRDAKAGSRYAFLTSQAVEMLKSRTQGKPSDYVFPSRRTNKEGGNAIGHVEKFTIGKTERISLTFARTVKELKLNEGIDDPRLQICFHSCRHSYASWLIDQGADLYTVQKLLGHKTNIMTQRYAHLSENRLKDAAKSLSKLWQNTIGEIKAGEVVKIGK